VFPQGGGVCNKPWLIFHVKNIRRRSLETYLKLNGGENITLGATFNLFMTMEISKGIRKGKKAFIGIYL